jgi:hypothetical protein
MSDREHIRELEEEITAHAKTQAELARYKAALEYALWFVGETWRSSDKPALVRIAEILKG